MIAARYFCCAAASPRYAAKRESRNMSDINGSKPTNFPLDESKLDFKIPRTDAPREKRRAASFMSFSLNHCPVFFKFFLICKHKMSRFDLRPCRRVCLIMMTGRVVHLQDLAFFRRRVRQRNSGKQRSRIRMQRMCK